MGPTTSRGNAKDLIWTLPEPESAGASTYVIVLEADADGCCGYLPEPDRPRQFRLGKAFASTRLAFIHTLRTVLLIDPASNALRGIAAFFEGHLRVYFFGALWGTWVDEEGRKHSEPNPVDQINTPKFFIRLGEKADRIRIEFGVTANNIELFVPSVRKRLRQPGSDYRLALDYSLPGGKFLLAEVVNVDPATGVVAMTYPVEGFPLRWPPVVGARAGGPPPSPRPPQSGERTAAPETDGTARQAAAGPADSKPPGSPTQRPAASTPVGPPRRTESASPAPPSPPTTATGAVPPEPPAGAPAGAPPGQPPPSPRLRVGPKLRLKPRTSGSEGADRTDRGGAPGGGTSEQPPPSTSYRLRPGQISDPLGRKTPFNEAAGPPPMSPPPRPSTRLKEPIRARAADTPPPKPAPLPRTEQLPTREMIEAIRGESDPDRRWKMIEPNLMLGRAERTYALIANFSELISDRSPEWPAARLRTAFASQPGAVLIGIMDRWHMNQVLAVAESNSESAKIMQWLREREVDRMLRLAIGREVTNAEQARQALRVDRSADEASIRKTWRILLQFLNADHGRRDEKAIHRQKDEIAKYLQVARDYLLKVTFR